MVVEWLALAAWAEPEAPTCDPAAPITLEVLQADLTSAEQAFADLDIDGFLALSDRVRTEVPCMGEVVPPKVAASLHRVEGLRRFGERDIDDVRSFTAARASDPDHVLPPEIAPPGSQLLADYGAMDIDAGEPVPLAEPIDAVLWIDGVSALERNSARPALAQLVGSDGVVRWTTYAERDADLPAYEAIPLPEPVLPPPPEPITVVVHRSPRVPLAVATGATALAAGITYGIGAASKATWNDPETPDGQLAGLKARTNTMAVASTASGVAALGLGAVLVITW
ncbi:MAG: hypothetical protein H6738_08055 [Alphaproteobacteria bacterium]|nr:hypothetical protein [Alphaproteobacteria bacterium]MCB9696717.1 hypothetical protein [Alphaproteobacteria bacterium]